jgi:HlyD family secretion protein
MRRVFTTGKSLTALLVVVALGAVAAWRARPAAGQIVDISETVARDVFRSYVTASGEIVATRFADVGSSVMGRVVALTVREGDRVRAGQTVARIDSVQAQSQTASAAALISALQAEQDGASEQVAVVRFELEAATARSVEATTALNRARDLYAAQLLPAAERDAAVAAADTAAAQVRAAKAAVARSEQALTAAARRVAQAQAEATRARDVFDKTNIAAPIDGIVSRLQVREGEMVVVGIQNQPGTTLMTISDLSAIDAEVKVAEADVLRLQPGQAATVTLDAVPERLFPGRVVEIGVSALPSLATGAAAREFRVVIRLDDTATTLRPGLTCDAEILAQERANVVTAPLQAVVLRPPAPEAPDTPGVFVYGNGRTIFTPITTGIIGGLDVEISGVPAGTAVVTGPFQVLRTLQHDTAVRVRPSR